MTRTDICNMALRAVGEQTIMNLTETSKNAEICNLYFEQVYKDLLRDENWNFAIRRVILAETTSDPTFGYSNSFMLPADHIKTIRLTEQTQFKIEGELLLTNSDSASMVYVAYQDDMNKLDAKFVKNLYLALAVEMAYTLVENNTIINGLLPRLEKAELDARFVNSSEGTADYIDASDWRDSRIAGSDVNYNKTNIH
jgi:hypothetical protein